MFDLSSTGTAAGQGLNGESLVLSVERAIDELKHGRFIAVAQGDRALVAAPVETVPFAAITRLRGLAEEAALILTPERAAALKTRTVGPVSIELAKLPTTADLYREAGLAGLAPNSAVAAQAGPWTGAQTLVAAAFRLSKAARLMPALIGVELSPDRVDASISTIGLAAVERFAQSLLPRVQRISSSRVPLAGAEDSAVTLFRDTQGGEHVAVTIGSPDVRAVVPVRLHSACLTGDILGSLRCDCGEQLHTAVRRLAELGGGVLLYLDQEGRGIGLANKLRAYALQDQGLDTLDADRHLGFRSDERSYGVAAAILSELGIGKIALLTNNPEKISALRELGIDVSGRMSLVARANSYNENYLRAKRERAGHLTDDR